jgi:hypothetical protein
MAPFNKGDIYSDIFLSERPEKYKYNAWSIHLQGVLLSSFRFDHLNK